MKLDGFRNDINGLRAIAVIMVVLFHFNVPFLTSGFAGVDIFFVISGYLMTKIIVEKMAKHTFSFYDFYMARAVRILPALLSLCFIIYIASLFLLIPEDLSYFSLYAIRSIFFLSNYYLMKETEGYFSPASHDNILLHTWSLSVEWQFYIVLPIFIYCIYKIFKKKFVKESLIILCLSSFLISILLKDNAPYAYYLFPSRAWEMLIGGIIFCYFNTQPKRYNFIFFVGLLMLLASSFIFTNNSTWPYFGTLIPTIGTALVISARKENSFLSQNKAIQIIGTSSYSIYLWHWPIFVIFNYCQLSGVFYICLAIALSFACGYLSYRFIEQPTKNWLSARKKNISIIYLTSTSIIVCVIFKLTTISGGFPERITSDKYMVIDKEMQLPLPKNGWCFYSVDNIKSLSVGNAGLSCHVGSIRDDAKKVILFGDSFAGQYIPFWDIIGKKENLNINVVTTNWCYPSSGNDFNGRKESRAYTQCLINRKFLSDNMAKFDLVIFAGEWKRVMPYPSYKNGFQDIFNQAIKHNLKVILMSEPYAFDVDIGKIYKRAIWVNTSFDIEKYKKNSARDIQKNSDMALQKMAQNNQNVMIIGRNEMFNDNQYAVDNIPYSWDGKHISVIGSMSAEKFFEHNGGLNKISGFIKN